jgi:hypothetical protein
MARGIPLHPDYAAALRLLDAVDRPYAELWRMTGFLSPRIGEPQPSYFTVRRFLLEERRVKLARAALASAVLDELLRGTAPWSLLRSLEA